MRRALIVVDVQKDFCEGGALAVAGGNNVATRIADFVAKVRYDLIVTSQDWHSPENTNGGHFADRPDYSTSWPRHCVAGEAGAEIHEDLASALSALGSTPILAVRKGWGEPAYSAFDGVVVGEEGLDLEDALARYGITDVDVAGIATDFCVAATARAAQRLGLDPVVLGDLTASVNPDRDAALDDLSRDGILIGASA